MAAPWRPRDTVNNSCYVASEPLPSLAAPPLTGHSARTMLLTDVNRCRREHSKHLPVSSRPATALIFAGFAYARRPQGRLRSVFLLAARHSRGFLRRSVDVWRCD